MSAGAQAVPSLVNGSAVQFEEIGTRASIRSAGRPLNWFRRMPPGVSPVKAPVASKWPTKPRASPLPCASVQVTYGVLPKNVMSGWVASASGGEIGLPWLNSSKWSPPTRRDTKTAWWPPTSSDHVTHGTVAPPGTSEPAATRGSSASLPAALLSEQASSASVDSAHEPKALAPAVSSGFRCPAVPLPTARQLKPPSAFGSATMRAAKTCSLLRRPMLDASFSYQTVQPTVSPGPVNAMSGSTPLRLGSTFSVGSPLPEKPPSLPSRSRPTCCQQNALTLAAEDGLKPVHGWLGAACLTPLETK